jgi:Rod binding domain-containing protein
MGAGAGVGPGLQLSSAARLTASASGQANQAAGQATGGPSPKLVSAAREFEAQMMKELLQPMTEGDALGGEDDDDSGLALGSGSGSGGALADFASESLGRALSERGGFGIADQIIRELSKKGNQSGTGKVTRDLHGNTVMRTLK